MAENVLIERLDRIAIVTINRPDKLNALNIQTRLELSDALDELREDDQIRVVVITGSGEKAFVAGADISEFEGRTAVQQRAVMRSRNIFTSAEDFPKPLIAMINGFCLGGGNELAMSCDLRIASEKARFGQPEINLGIIPGGGPERSDWRVLSGKAGRCS
jgi:enoyl-CoA hydratase